MKGTFRGRMEWELLTVDLAACVPQLYRQPLCLVTFHSQWTPRRHTTRKRPLRGVLSIAFLTLSNGFAQCCLGRNNLFECPSRCATVSNWTCSFGNRDLRQAYGANFQAMGGDRARQAEWELLANLTSLRGFLQTFGIQSPDCYSLTVWLCQ